MGKVFVTCRIPEVGITLLREAGHEVIVSGKDGALTTEELTSAVAGDTYDALLTLLSDKIDATLLGQAPSVKIVSNYAVGYNNIDVVAATERGVVVTNTPDVLNDSVAEFTIALMMAVAKRIPEADRFTRAGQYRGWLPELLLGSDLRGKTLGIVGAGRIGAAVAHIAHHGLGMHIAYYDLKPSASLEETIQCTFFGSLDELLKNADVVSIHVPLLESTRHLINAERLTKMKPEAYLINTARGPVVDEVALATALTEKTIAGAGLDVFEFEPAVTNALMSMDNVVITPHIASASRQTRDKMAILAAEAIIDCLSGVTPQHVVRG